MFSIMYRDLPDGEWKIKETPYTIREDAEKDCFRMNELGGVEAKVVHIGVSTNRSA